MEFPTNDAELTQLVDSLVAELQEIRKSEEPLAKKDGPLEPTKRLDDVAPSNIEGSGATRKDKGSPSGSRTTTERLDAVAAKKAEYSESSSSSSSAKKAEYSGSESSSSASLSKDDDDGAGSPSASGGEGSVSSGGPPAEDAPPSEGAPSDPSAAAPPAGPPGASPGSDAPPSVEEIAAMFEQLPPDQLEVYAQALQMAQQKMGGGMGAPPPAGPPSPSAPPVGGPPSPSMAGGPPPPSPLAQSEKRIADLEEKLSKAMDQLSSMSKHEEKMVEVLKKAVGEPIQKSVNGINYFKRVAAVPEFAPAPLKKSVTEMTKVEIKNKLSEVAQNPKLTKSDRDLINRYIFAPGSVSPEQLEKLFQ